MTLIQVEEPVELTLDIPELGLHRGDHGMVCSTWFNPIVAYEVEFQQKTPESVVRALLLRNQIKGEAEQQSVISTPLLPSFSFRNFPCWPEPRTPIRLVSASDLPCTRLEQMIWPNR